MKTSFPRVVLALFALSFVVAACASESGTTWTYAPTTESEAVAPAEPAASEATDAPAQEPAQEPAEAEATEAPAEEPTEPEATEAPAEEPEAPTESAAPAAAGEPRVIAFEADGAIRFMQDGEQMREIAVTPGETVIFQIDNTAGFPHNFWIGPDPELQEPNGETDFGIPDWETGVQEIEWVVPEDISGLRFACTVPGHYYTMQGDFLISP